MVCACVVWMCVYSSHGHVLCAGYHCSIDFKEAHLLYMNCMFLLSSQELLLFTCECVCVSTVRWGSVVLTFPSRCLLLCVCVCVWFPQEIWMATGWTMRHGIAAMPPQCLWWDMRSPAPNPPPSSPSQSPLSFHVCFVLFTPPHGFSSFFLFFLSHTCRGQSKGEKKNYWAGIFVRLNTQHLIWEAKENGALWGPLIGRGRRMVWTPG